MYLSDAGEVRPAKHEAGPVLFRTAGLHSTVATYVGLQYMCTHSTVAVTK